jgi:hypothetical protein
MLCHTLNLIWGIIKGTDTKFHLYNTNRGKYKAKIELGYQKCQAKTTQDQIENM